jgi:dipeptidyl-peptidase-4
MKIPIEEISRFPLPGMDLPSNFSFSPDGEYLTYLKSKDLSGYKCLYGLRLSDKTEFLILEHLGNLALQETLEEQLRKQRMRQMSGGISEYFWSKDSKIFIPHQGNIYKLDTPFSSPDLIISATDYPTLDVKASPDGNFISFVCNGDIYLLEVGSSNPTRLTVGDDSCTRGLADYIAQEEMGRGTGYWWSPDSRYVAFTEVAEKHIPEFFINHVGSDTLGPSVIESHRYPFAGQDNPRVRLGVVDVESQESTWVESTEHEYIARVNWFPDNSLAIQTQSRDQHQLKVRKFVLNDHTLNTIIEENSETWINLHDMLKPMGLGRFLWVSERTGFKHIYLFSEGKLTAITKGEWQVDSIESIDEDSGIIFFTGTKDGYTEKHLYRTCLEGKAVERITAETGLHNVLLNGKAKLFVDIFNSLHSAPTVTLKTLEIDSDIEIIIHESKDERIKRYKLEPPELVKFTVDNGTELSGAIYYPNSKEFEPPYPTVLSVYGGPHVQMVANSWFLTASMRAQYLRSKGYLVLVVDNRGSARRGLQYEAPIKYSMGKVEVEDQVFALNVLIKTGVVDKDRIGVYGWSYGGYISLMCLAQKPDLFKAAVSGAPVTSWDGYDTHYTERYMGIPSKNQAGYEESSVLSHVSTIEGKLMLVHGLLDENVHFRHTARLINSLNAAGKEYDLLLFPEERHMPRRLEDRAYMERRILGFLEENV